MSIKKRGTSLLKNIKLLIEEGRNVVVRNVNAAMILTYYHVGRIIVEHEQLGKLRAEYAQETLKKLSRELTRDYGKGYSERNLEHMRKFYMYYSTHTISQTVSAKLKSTAKKRVSAISQTVSAKLQKPNMKLISSAIFNLSWSHYVTLLRINNHEERNFYEIETVNNNWSVRELERQYNSSLYERLALSRNKKGIRELSKKGQLVRKPLDTLKDPFILEFIGLKENHTYTESDLETAIINRLEHFMLEMGKGFLFEGRQRRFSFDNKHFFVDLVFYNRLLNCFVLIDLKIGELTHQDVGQMQMYVNYYDRVVKTKSEHKTIGIVLCKQSNTAVVEFTLPKNNKQIFSREYKLYLPSKQQLKKQLM